MFFAHVFILFIVALVTQIEANADAKRLYDDLMSSYNSLIRPVGNVSERVTVKMGVKLSQLVDVNLKNQIMTTNLWVEQEWMDYKLRWNPDDYGGVDTVYVPADQIWLPDIVLYNNADGNYEVIMMTKAVLRYDGKVTWNPPAMFRSTCEMDVEWFPFDEQTCLMRFGSWTYDGHEVDLRHVLQTDGSDEVPIGIDMSNFYKSVEWDVLLVPVKYNEQFFDCCPEPFPDLTFNITMRRKTLFYTVNLIIPCVAISFLTVLVFYLPSECCEKVTLSISILVSLTVFFLLLAEIIPPTSLAVPLLGKYLLFTMILVTLSICVTVGVLNVHYRSPATHKMSPWVRTLFIHMLPRLLLMKRPSHSDLEEELSHAADVPCKGFNDSPDIPCKFNGRSGYRGLASAFEDDIPGLPVPTLEAATDAELGISSFITAPNRINWMNEKLAPDDPSIPPNHQYSPAVQKAIESILYIADHIKKQDKDKSVIEDWKYVAMVLDRLFLWIFTIACLAGTCGIILQAPSLYDERSPIDAQTIPFPSV